MQDPDKIDRDKNFREFMNSCGQLGPESKIVGRAAKLLGEQRQRMIGTHKPEKKKKTVGKEEDKIGEWGKEFIE